MVLSPPSPLEPTPPSPYPLKRSTSSSSPSASSASSSLPRTISDGLHLVAGILVGIYTEAYSYSPSVLGPVMATLGEHLVAELAEG